VQRDAADVKGSIEMRVRYRRFGLALAVLTVLGAACKHSSGGLGADESFSWTHPFRGKGVEVATAADAMSKTSFNLDVPKPLGTMHIFLSPYTDAQGRSDAVWFVIQSPKFGIVWIGESAPDVPDDAERLASYQDRVAQNGQPGVLSVAEIVTVRGGVTALLGVSPDGVATLQWVENQTQVDVQGPTLTRAQVLDIASWL
jgi:hypothetical protein